MSANLRTINRFVFSSAIVAAFTALVHIFLGGKEIVPPLLNSAISGIPKLVLYACWHGVSVMLALSAIALFRAAFTRYETSRQLIIFISVLWISFALVFLAIAVNQPEAGWIWKLPQWTLLLPVGLLGLLGIRKKK